MPPVDGRIRLCGYADRCSEHGRQEASLHPGRAAAGSLPPVKAVQFGAGNIGRGFIAQLFFESGFETVFVDVDSGLLAALESERGYTIHIVGPGATDIRIENIRAVNASESGGVAGELADCDGAC